MRRTWQVNADGTIALRSGQQLYSNTKGWVGVAQEGDHTNTSSGRRTWDGLPRVPGPHLVAPHIANSQVALNDGRQLYVNPGGWAGATGPGQDTNTAPGRNTWTHQPNGTLTLHDGKQLYSNPDGWCGVALEGEHTNCDPMRRTWQVNADGTIALRSGQQLYSNTKGWVGVAQEGAHTNTFSGRRTWRAV